MQGLFRMSARWIFFGQNCGPATPQQIFSKFTTERSHSSQTFPRPSALHSSNSVRPSRKVSSGLKRKDYSLQPKNIIPTKRKVLEKKVNPASWLSLDAGARGVQPNRTHIRWDNPVYMNGGTKREFKNAESLTGWCLYKKGEQDKEEIVCYLCVKLETRNLGKKNTLKFDHQSDDGDDWSRWMWRALNFKVHYFLGRQAGGAVPVGGRMGLLSLFSPDF